MPHAVPFSIVPQGIVPQYAHWFVSGVYRNISS